MTLPRSVSEVVAEHTVFEVECIDRMYLNVYVPQLQHAGGIVGYVHQQLGLPIASTAALGKITDAFSTAMRRFAVTQGVPWVDFVKGQRKDEVMHRHLARFEAAGLTEGVLFVGRAQEKTALFRTEKRRDAEGKAYPWIVKTTGLVNHFYLYPVDADFGAFFLKFCSYFPYHATLCVNGHEWAKRQTARAGIGFTALDNAFAAVDDVAAVQAICGGLGPAQVDALLRTWLARVPHPFTAADRAAGYRYDISILPAEFSLTQILDRPVSGRIFFEQVIRDNLDLGRPDQVSLVFDRRLIRSGPRATPGRFRTRVITEGVTPSLHVDYKHATIKQYHKEGRALRTETQHNLPALRLRRHRRAPASSARPALSQQSDLLEARQPEALSSGCSGRLPAASRTASFREWLGRSVRVRHPPGASPSDPLRSPNCTWTNCVGRYAPRDHLGHRRGGAPGVPSRVKERGRRAMRFVIWALCSP